MYSTCTLPFISLWNGIPTCTYLWEILYKHFYRVLKSDIIRNQFVKLCDFWGLWKNNIQKAHFPKISIPVQIAFEILAQLCSDNSIQIFLSLTQFITLLGTRSNLEGLAWSHQGKMGLIHVSPRQFAMECKFLASTRVGLLDDVLWKYPNRSHNFKNLIFMTSSL